jgi:hypothetical protein
LLPFALLANIIEQSMSALNTTNTLVARILRATLVTISLAGCSDLGTDSVYNDPAGLTIVAKQSDISVTNNTADTVHCYVVERQTASLINWAAGCGFNTVGCNRTREIPYSTVSGYFKGCEALLYWWHCYQATNGELQPGPIRAIIVKTR